MTVDETSSAINAALKKRILLYRLEYVIPLVKRKQLVFYLQPA